MPQPLPKPAVTPGERRALLFIAILFLLALGYRVAEGRRVRRAVPVADSLALERQLGAIAAKRTEEGKRKTGARRKADGERRKGGAPRDTAAALSWQPPRAPRPWYFEPSPSGEEGRRQRRRASAPRTGHSLPPSANRLPPPSRLPLSSAQPPVDLDQATFEQLTALPGVGPALAARILADRADHGPFGSLEALDGVRGVGPAMRERLRPLVTFSGPPRRMTAGRPERRSQRAP